MNDDAQLLRQYVETGSEPAFRELVERHIQLVNSTARRMVAGDAHLAQDVTQLVFTDLARKAAALPPGVVLGGWLHRHTCFTAAKAVRTECRRRARERTAMEINAANDPAANDAHWAQLAPVLDDALNRLDAPDRDAIVLRFLQRRDMRSVGQALGTSDDAAQKRVSRALDKLRALLTQRGVAVSSTALLASTLDGATVAAVPHGLAAAVSAHALGAVATTGAGLTLLSLKTMITSKLALGLAATTAFAVTTALVISHNGNNPAPAPAASISSPVASVPKHLPQIFTAGKVEAPKAAPAPAGDKPATPNDLAAMAASPAVGSETTLIPMLSTMLAGQKGNITLTSSAMDEHSASVTGDGVNVTYTIDGVSHTVPAGTAMTLTDPQTGSTVSIGPRTISVNGSGGGIAGGRGFIVGSGSVGGYTTDANEPTGSMRRSVSIVNGQMTTTTTVNGVTTTSTSPAPSPGTMVDPPLPSGASLPGSTSGAIQTMTMVDQNGVIHTVQVPAPISGNGSGAVLITTNPDGTTNVLQAAPTPTNP